MAEGEYPEDLMSGGKAAFHAAPLKLWALRMCWDRANDFRRLNNFVDWKKELDIIYGELLFVIKAKDRDKKATILKEVLTAFKEWQGKGKRISMGKETADNVYMGLSKYDEFLRGVSGGAGLDMPSTSDPKHAFR